MNMRLILPGPRWPWFPLLMGAALRLVNINAPIIGVHSWRQADTAALARNFQLNQLPIWLPQVDWGGVSSGYAETDFPLYSYGVGLLYQFFGLHEWLARGLSLLCSIGAIYLVQRLGSNLFGQAAGWWGGLFFAVLPSLVKVLPLFWLGIPLLWLGWRRWPLWLAGVIALLATVAWYAHAHQLFLETGLSFGFWGSKASRYSWADLLNWRYWGDILLRFSLRGLAVLGLPLLVFGLWLPKQNEAEGMLPLGLGVVLIAGALAPSSSYIHEYYQLPLLLFACPLLGKASQKLQLKSTKIGKRWLAVALGLVLIISFTVLQLDYWSKENPNKSDIWAQAQEIKTTTPKNKPLISVTAGDPTLLYLSERKGWLVTPEAVNNELLSALRKEGASAVVGSWNKIENYSEFKDGPVKQKLAKLLGINKNQTNGNYIIILK